MLGENDSDVPCDVRECHSLRQRREEHQVREAARAQVTRSGRVPQSAIDAELQSFDDKDLHLTGLGR